MDLIERLKSARRVSVPLVAIETADPAATLRIFAGEEFATVGDHQTGLLCWDLVNGIVPHNEAGKVAKSEVCSDNLDDKNLMDVLIGMKNAPAGTVLLVKNAHRFLGELPVMQAVWNLRDVLKKQFRMLVLLGPTWTLPVELQADVVVLSQPLPGAEELAERIGSIMKSAKLGSKVDPHAIDAVRGLTAFQAEQQAAMAARKDGINVESLWESKRKLIEQTPGLAVENPPCGFDGIGGVDVAKEFTRAVLNGNRAPRSIVFIDEIEKALAGFGGDTSGVAQDQVGTLLSYMQDRRSTGMLFYGPPGAAKSAVAKAAGREVGIPTIRLDLGATKGSLVGQSEQQLRSALKVIDAVSDGNSLWIATCNSTGVLPPELLRRFTLGTYFFDLPSAEERDVIWAIYKKKYGLNGKVTNDEGWTGAEIERACDIADRLGVTLDVAAKSIVPVAKSASDKIEAMRRAANGKFLSASNSGVYVYEATEKRGEKDGRSMAL